MIHIVLIVFGKVIIDTLPGMTQQMSWTLVNLVYLAVSPQTFWYCLVSITTYLVCSSHTLCSTGLLAFPLEATSIVGYTMT